MVQLLGPYPRRQRRPWTFRFAIGLLILSAALAWWLRWEPADDTTPRDLLETRRLGAPQTNAPARALKPGSATNRPGLPAAVQRLQSTNPLPPATRFDPNPNLVTSPVDLRAWNPRPVQTLLEAQIALARQAISPGSIDGTSGPRTRLALKAFQLRNGLRPTGSLDAATRGRLLLTEPPYTQYVVSPEDIARLMPVGRTWLEKSAQPRLDYETLDELVGEKWQTDPDFIRQLNQDTGWMNLVAGTSLKVPNVRSPAVTNGAAWVRIKLSDRTLQAFDEATNLLAHFPCSVARSAEKRPVGRLQVTVTIPNPNYTYDPSNFGDAARSGLATNKLTLPPGPNNPVGTAWIGLNRPGYGIHGTPRPDHVGVPESLGCFRLANWNAEHLARLAWPGMPVLVEP